MARLRVVAALLAGCMVLTGLEVRPADAQPSHPDHQAGPASRSSKPAKPPRTLKPGRRDEAPNPKATANVPDHSLLERFLVTPTGKGSPS
jgi:hypothetical protein